MSTCHPRSASPHGTYHSDFNGLLAYYRFFTPGVEVADNATVILGDLGEPQPDLFLRILPEYGGRSRTTDDEYMKERPSGSGKLPTVGRAIDLNQKRLDYHTYGVQEYVILCVRERALRWFDLQKP